jgi:hypothetical protein
MVHLRMLAELDSFERRRSAAEEAEAEARKAVEVAKTSAKAAAAFMKLVDKKDAAARRRQAFTDAARVLPSRREVERNALEAAASLRPSERSDLEERLGAEIIPYWSTIAAAVGDGEGRKRSGDGPTRSR